MQTPNERVNRILRGIAIAWMTIHCASSASAQQSAPGSAGLISGGDSWVSLEPRVWVTFVQAIDAVNVKKETVVVPMGGASLTITPPVIEGLSLLVTGLYGKGDGDALLLAGFDLQMDAEIERLDIEALIRYQLPETNVSFFIGPRFVTFDETYEIAGLDQTLDTALTILEFGIGGYGNLTDSGRHRVFGNLTAGVAFRESEFDDDGFAFGKATEEEVESTLDVNLGYQWLVRDWLAINVRYRAFLYFNSENDFGTDDVLSVHGPEAGVTIRF